MNTERSGFQIGDGNRWRQRRVPLGQNGLIVPRETFDLGKEPIEIRLALYIGLLLRHASRLHIPAESVDTGILPSAR